MNFYNKKLVVAIYASLAAVMLFTFQNCSANLFSAATAIKVEACEKEFLPVSDMIKSSEREIQVTKNLMKSVKKKNVIKTKLIAKTGAKAPAKLQSKTIAKKPARKAASQGEMRIKLKKIRAKKVRAS